MIACVQLCQQVCTHQIGEVPSILMMPTFQYSATSHIRAVWDQGGPVIVKVPVSMNPLLPVYTLRHFTL